MSLGGAPHRGRLPVSRLGTCIALGAAMLAGCTGDDFGDLRAFTEQAKRQAAQNARIEPLPDVQPYETYIYKAEERRDPFTPTTIGQEVPESTSESGIRPDPNRRKEALEQFPLDTLRMVGTLQRDSTQWAIINAPDKTIHRVTIGNYMGQNYGRIVDISEQSVEMIEIIPNGLGGWRERDTSVALSE